MTVQTLPRAGSLRLMGCPLAIGFHHRDSLPTRRDTGRCTAIQLFENRDRPLKSTNGSPFVQILRETSFRNSAPLSERENSAGWAMGQLDFLWQLRRVGVLPTRPRQQRTPRLLVRPSASNQLRSWPLLELMLRLCASKMSNTLLVNIVPVRAPILLGKRAADARLHVVPVAITEVADNRQL